MVSICILFIWSLCRTSLKLSTHFFSEEACYVSVTLTHILGLFFLPPCQTPVERCLALFSPGSDSKAIAHLPQKSPQNPKTKSTERERSTTAILEKGKMPDAFRYSEEEEENVIWYVDF